MADRPDKLRIQVCYAHLDRQLLTDLTVSEGTTISQAIRLSGIANEVSGLDIATCKVGVYGKLKSLDTPVRAGDRIEIYRPLLADPKEARRRRAKKT